MVTHLCHTTVNNKVCAVDEAALIAGQEQNGLGLFDRFSKSAGREMNLASMTLGLIVAEPVLE